MVYPHVRTLKNDKRKLLYFIISKTLQLEIKPTFLSLSSNSSPYPRSLSTQCVLFQKPLSLVCAASIHMAAEEVLIAPESHHTNSSRNKGSWVTYVVTVTTTVHMIWMFLFLIWLGEVQNQVFRFFNHKYWCIYILICKISLFSLLLILTIVPTWYTNLCLS